MSTETPYMAEQHNRIIVLFNNYYENFRHTIDSYKLMADCVSKMRWIGVNQNKIKILRE